AVCMMPMVANAPPAAPAIVASATTAAIAPRRRLPGPLPGPCSASAFASVSPRQERSPCARISILPAVPGALVLIDSTLGISDLVASTFGASILGASAFGASWSGAIAGESILPLSGAAALVPALGVSWVCSDGSLTCNSPELIDHLVTFIPCQFLTGGGLTEILGISPGGFLDGHGATGR